MTVFIYSECIVTQPSLIQCIAPLCTFPFWAHALTDIHRLLILHASLLFCTKVCKTRKREKENLYIKRREEVSAKNRKGFHRAQLQLVKQEIYI